MSNTAGRIASFQAGLAYGLQRHLDPAEAPVLDDETMGPSPDSFGQGAQDALVAAFRKRHDL
jgi:hypothetical protein